ncbi:hypothetical protein [Natrinema salinisoli]|uniref:hypothetical protein n=1 Tax=Natrinema salinisoli TaxID=2878535 RepID=UPI001CF0702F|nr:hypothetical protein [Natrinema salinisoli]
MTVSEQSSEHSEQLVTTLRKQKERVVLALVEEKTIDTTPILRGDESLSTEGYVTLVYELHHVELPELEADDIIQFDHHQDEITRGKRFDTLSLE